MFFTIVGCKFLFMLSWEAFFSENPAERQSNKNKKHNLPTYKMNTNS